MVICAKAQITGVDKKDKEKTQRRIEFFLLVFLLKSLWFAHLCILTKPVILEPSLKKNKLPRSYGQLGAMTIGDDRAVVESV